MLDKSRRPGKLQRQSSLPAIDRGVLALRRDALRGNKVVDERSVRGLNLRVPGERRDPSEGMP
jgi:hypothetical protein